MRIADVTPAWMTAVLQKAGHPGVQVIELAATPVGTGQLADSHRVVPTYARDTAGVPASVVVKLTSEDEQSRATSREQASYLREVRYYECLTSTVAIRVPRCLHAEVDEAGSDFVLVLEDLDPAEQGDQVAGCSVQRCGTVVDQAARLHGPRWADPSLRSYAWLDVNAHLFPLAHKLLKAAFPAFCDRYADRLEPAAIEVGAAMVERLPTFFERQLDMPWTIQHGDFRPDNMLFDVKGGSEPLAVLDWQTIVLGPGVLDVAYFLGGALPTEARRAHEVDLFDRYYERLREHGVEYPRSRLWNDYRSLTFWLYLTAMGASMAVRRTDRGDAMFMSMIDRATRQILDLDALDTLGVRTPRPTGPASDRGTPRGAGPSPACRSRSAEARPGSRSASAP